MGWKNSNSKHELEWHSENSTIVFTDIGKDNHFLVDSFVSTISAY